MKQNAVTVWTSPLMGTERAFFENCKEELRKGYEASVQRLVDAWEASAATVTALTRKRSRHVRLLTFFGTIVLRCRPHVPRTQAEPALLAGHRATHGGVGHGDA